MKKFTSPEAALAHDVAIHRTHIANGILEHRNNCPICDMAYCTTCNHADHAYDDCTASGCDCKRKFYFGVSLS